jgi:phage tail-like protein
MPNTEPNPFTTFNFAVEMKFPGVSDKVCDAAFSDCDGLEMTMEVKTIREGGNNTRQHRLTGPLAYGQLTLKRGMTGTFHLWDWFREVAVNPSLRADAEVVVYGGDGHTVMASYLLTRCVPVKLKAPALSAASGGIAIEEFQLAYETMSLVKPGQGGG